MSFFRPFSLGLWIGTLTVLFGSMLTLLIIKNRVLPLGRERNGSYLDPILFGCAAIFWTDRIFQPRFDS